MTQVSQKNEPDLFLEIGKEQHSKQDHAVCGDLFLSRRYTEESRVITILADGLGSGIKASVLSTLTASMAAGCVSGNMDIRQTAEVILATLPVCRDRGLAYSTFSIVDTDLANRQVRVIEHENPRFLLVRNNRLVNVSPEHIPISSRSISSRHQELLYSTFELQEEDRIVLFSDGVTQAGLGQPEKHGTWGAAQAADHVLNTVHQEPEIAARHRSAA